MLLRDGRLRDKNVNSPLFEIALVLVRFNHVAHFIVNANHSVIEATLYISALGNSLFSITLPRRRFFTDNIWADL
jgi:hypothetical protein